MGPWSSKAIEEYKDYETYGDACDTLISRDEFNDDGILTVRRVLRRFERIGPVLDVVINGQRIGTTHEHPFFVKGQGWTKAQELRIGDQVRLMQPGWATVEAVEDTGRLERVYNLEIEDDHTYFVGDEATWGWAVWAHNSYKEFETAVVKANPSATPDQIKYAYSLFRAGRAGNDLSKYHRYMKGTLGVQGSSLGVATKAAKAGGQTYILFNISHRTSQPIPKGFGPHGEALQSHHGIQDKWARANLTGWSRGKAPTVTLETSAAVPGKHGTLPHTIISHRQNARQAAREAAGNGSWNSTLDQELGYIVGDFRAAGYNKATIKKVLQQQYDMLDALKLPYARVPGY